MAGTLSIHPCSIVALSAIFKNPFGSLIKALTIPAHYNIDGLGSEDALSCFGGLDVAGETAGLKYRSQVILFTNTEGILNIHKC